MTATGHALVGAFIAAKIANPLLAIPLALISHILSDLMPHWDAGTNAEKKSKNRMFFEAVGDVVLGFVLVMLFAVFWARDVNPFYMLVIVFVSQSFDWMTAPYYFFGLNYPPFTWTYRFQKVIEHKLDKPWGIVTQVLFVVAVFILTKLF